MNIELKQNIWKSDESGLGFYCINIYECSKQNPDLEELLKNDILKEKEFGPFERIKNELRGPVDHYGPILLKEIEISDFKTLDFNGLKSEINNYWKDEDWGKDLPIFQKNFELAIANLNKLNLSNRKFYYINAEKIDSKKLTEPNFFTYFVCIISTENKTNKLINLTFGLD
ncbi:MAG: hypothetical protein AAF090_04405 [Bacteroidota bacterium]